MKQLIAITAAAVLTACGGGGGGSDTPAVTATGTAEGFWNGAISGYTANVAVLENGETWGIYTSGNSLVGAVYGQTLTNGSTMSGSGMFFNFAYRQSGAGTYSGSFVPKSSLNLTTSDGAKFIGTYDATYDQPASLANLAGTYNGLSITGTTNAVLTTANINTSGAITGSAQGCNVAGTAKPRASGKNVFDIQLAFAGTCALGNGASTKGVANYDTSSRQLLVLTLNSTKSDGLMFIGQR